MKTYRYGSTTSEISAFMDRVVRHEREFEVPFFLNRFGEPINRTTLSTTVNRIKKDNYPHRTFYSYVNRSGVLMFGVRKMAEGELCEQL